jgi:hypothetical protein
MHGQFPEAPDEQAAAGLDRDFSSSGGHRTDVSKSFTARCVRTKMLADFGPGFRPTSSIASKTAPTVYPPES